MKRKKRKSSRNLAKPVTGSRRGWVTRLPVFRFPTVSAPHHVSLYLGNLGGLPIWRGKLSYFQLLFSVDNYLLAAAVLCRLMRAQTLGDTSSLEFMRARRVFEINPEHPIIKNLNVS